MYIPKQIWPGHKTSRPTQDHRLNNPGRTLIPNVTYQGPSGEDLSSSGEDFLKVFTIYRHGGHLGHVTRTI